jgi:hypothetical protein
LFQAETNPSPSPPESGLSSAGVLLSGRRLIWHKKDIEIENTLWKNQEAGVWTVAKTLNNKKC